ncbi:metalloprotease LoiP [Pseudomonas mangiferae]|uniref:M48 family metalloprotease n=1 Tax=Pseudomonas mangiferae TaxID=2593654 RepID=A0A553H424_9PSED|nr:M48 family metalloprotease [Pseudomonas mangiferae]TRX76509.1 M48 family metalloprotease [Pseudomonas mangiferae]
MKKQTLASLIAAATLLGGCQNFDAGGLMDSGVSAFKAATLSDAEVKQIADGACKQQDKENKIAPAGSKYTQRLNKIAKALGSEIEGTPVNYKVYLTKEENAWAMANGCIRVYSGLMDSFTDNEIEGVLGHEMGHVALGHSKKAAQIAYASQAARMAAASSTNAAVSSLSSSDYGALGEELINSQFSQSQESDADAFSVQLLLKRKLNPMGLATAMDKLAKEEGSDHSLLSSHPASTERAEHIRELIAASKK